MAGIEVADKIGKVYADGVQIKEVYTGPDLIYKAESDPITLTKSVLQNEVGNGGGPMNKAHIDYKITEDWETMTVLDSYWGKSYGAFQTVLYLIDGSTTTTLVSRSGGYNGYADSVRMEPIVASGVTYPVKKGQAIRLEVGANFNNNLSGQFTTTSWITFKLT